MQRTGERSDGSKEVDSLHLKLQAAQEELEATRASLTAAEKAVVDAEKALHRWVPPLSAVSGDQHQRDMDQYNMDPCDVDQYDMNPCDMDLFDVEQYNMGPCRVHVIRNKVT